MHIDGIAILGTTKVAMKSYHKIFEFEMRISKSCAGFSTSRCLGLVPDHFFKHSGHIRLLSR